MDLRKFSGMQLIVDPCMPKTKEVHRQERKWAHRVMFERWRRFNVKHGPVVYFFEGKVVCHPSVVEMIAERAK